MNDLVLGFALSHDLSEVALIRKNRPAFMAGFLNGLGGHIEPGETDIEAMAREFYEEAGVEVTNWHKIDEVILDSSSEKPLTMSVFTCITELSALATMTDEEVVLKSMAELYGNDFIKTIEDRTIKLSTKLDSGELIGKDVRGIYIPKAVQYFRRNRPKHAVAALLANRKLNQSHGIEELKQTLDCLEADIQKRKIEKDQGH